MSAYPAFELDLTSAAHPSLTTPFLGLSRTALLTTLLLAPLAFGAVLPSGWAVIVFGVCLALLFWAVACARTGRLNAGITPLHLAAAGTLLLALGQMLTRATLDMVATRESIVKLAAYLIIAFLASTLFSMEAEAWALRLGGAITVYGFALSILAIVQSFSSPGRIYWLVAPRFSGSVFGPYVNHNHYAGLMEMLIPLVLAHLLYRRRAPARWFIAFAALLMCASVVLCGSRSGLLIVLAEIVVIAAVAWSQSPGGRRRIAIAAILLATAGAGLGAWLVPNGMAQRVENISSSAQLDWQMRRDMASDALQIFRAHLVCGIGLGAFETGFPQYQTFASDYLIDHAHNDYAEFLAETGLTGAFLLLIGSAAFVRRAARNLRNFATSAQDWISLGATVACFGLLLHSFSDFNLHIPANAAWFAFCAGLTCSGTCTHPLLLHPVAFTSRTEPQAKS